MLNIIRASLWGAVLPALLVSAAVAQTAPVRVRGSIQSLAGQDLTIATREGPALVVKLAENVRVVAVAKATLADIKPGSYVGIAAIPRPDGSQMAIEVLIFPEALRGAGEGHRPWDLMPDSTMTNATVDDVVSKVSGPVLTLKYKEGDKSITVPPEAPIVTFVPADRNDMKPGVGIFTSVTKAPDGTASTAQRHGRQGRRQPAYVTSAGRGISDKDGVISSRTMNDPKHGDALGPRTIEDEVVPDYAPT